MPNPALEKIRRKVPRKSVATAITVYAALVEISEDAKSKNFTATHNEIAARSGLSRDTVVLRMADLLRARTIKRIACNGLSATYDLSV